MYHPTVQHSTAKAYVAADGARIIDIVDVLVEAHLAGVFGGETKNLNQSYQMRPTDAARFSLAVPLLIEQTVCATCLVDEFSAQGSARGILLMIGEGV